MVIEPNPGLFKFQKLLTTHLLVHMKNKPLSYLKEVREEMKKVTWPNRKSTIRYSAVVIGISALVAVFFAILDFGFNLGLEALLTLTR